MRPSPGGGLTGDNGINRQTRIGKVVTL